jgi:zinc transport system permease protein
MSLEFLELEFMRRALLAAFLVGLTAPSVGVYLVQRRQALMGDGIGHIALTGVALGVLLGTAPVATAVVVASLGAVAMELVRARGRTSGDVALAILFYGGIAGGVLLLYLAPNGGGTTGLVSYLFGSLTTVDGRDLVVMGALSLLVLAVTIGLSPRLFAVCQDEEYAHVAGLPVRALNIVLAVTAAVTVTVAMRVVGVLLVSALMVVPVATAQLVTRGFRATLALALVLGVAHALAGVVFSYYADVPSGPSIVVLAIGGFAVVSVLAALTQRWRASWLPAPTVTADDVRVDPYDTLGEADDLHSTPTTGRDR